MERFSSRTIQKSFDYYRLLCNQLCEASAEQSSATNQVNQTLRLLENLERTCGSALPLTRLCKTLKLKGFSWFCVVLALTCELDGGLRNRLQELTGTPTPTFDAAAGLYMHFDNTLPLAEPALLADAQNSPLAPALFLENRSITGPAVFTPLVLRPGVLQFLTCGASGRHAFYTRDTLPQEIIPIHQELLETLCSSVRAPSGYLFLTGPRGSGKRTLLMRAAETLNRPALFLDCRVLVPLEHASTQALAQDLSLDVRLSGGLLCCTHFQASNAPMLEGLLRDVPAHITLILLSEGPNSDVPPLRGQGPLCLRVGALSPADYATTYRFYSERLTLPTSEPAFYHLTIGRLRAVLDQTAQLTQTEPDTPCASLLARAVRMQEPPLALAQTIESGNTLSDLLIDEQARERIGILCSLIRANQQITIPTRQGYKGVTALFYGPSGTGKTMAAGALANELGLELLQIDLSRVLDKYIGETEKHLSALFAAAKDRNCILFFDEADALFGKRTEITSSHDRYANVETSFLLQSIEAFDGAVILATNLFKNFDDAFLRRIQTVVRFSMPDEQRRRHIWESALRGLRLAQDVDLGELAELEQFSPAMIASVAQTARLLTAGRETVLSARELLILVDMEKVKQ